MMLVLIRALPISNLVGFYNLNNWKPAKIGKILMENFQTVRPISLALQKT